jgi:hypothetical protein
VERWKSGFSKDIIHFKLYVRSAFGGPFAHFSNIPAFQYSDWGEAPNLFQYLIAAASSP